MPRLASFGELRELARHPAIRPQIELRRDEIARTGWDIVPKSPPRGRLWGSVAMRRYSSRRAEAVKFFRQPDANYQSLAGWLGQVVEDLIVTDAVVIHMRKAAKEGRGLLGGDLWSLDLLSGDTIDPLTDDYGAAAGVAQYLSEVPRHDFADAILGRPAAGNPLARYGNKDVLYLRMSVRRFTPFGYSPLEQSIVRREVGSIDADATAERFGQAAGDRWARPCWTWPCLSFLADVFNHVLDESGAGDLRWTWEEASADLPPPGSPLVAAGLVLDEPHVAVRDSAARSSPRVPFLVADRLPGAAPRRGGPVPQHPRVARPVA